MKVQIGDKVYIFKWDYYTDKNHFMYGSTFCKVKLGEYYYDCGRAELSKEDPQFIKKIGRKISFARALKFLNLSKEERRQAWEAYKRECKL